MHQSLRSVARRMHPRVQNLLRKAYVAYEKVAPERIRTYDRMAAGQHLDFEEVERLVTPADGTVIDIGAERGEVCRFFLDLGFSVVGLEPEAKNFSVLKRLRSRRFRPLNVACSDHTASGVLDVRPGTYYHALSTDGTTKGQGQAISIVTPGDVVKKCGIKKISVLKVDVEGGEEAVLRGVFSTTNLLPKVIVSEFTKDNVRAVTDILRDRYPYKRFVCRWNEAPGLTTQMRTLVIDGEDPLVFEATWGNIIASQVPFRHVYPLKGEAAVVS